MKRLSLLLLIIMLASVNTYAQTPEWCYEQDFTANRAGWNSDGLLWQPQDGFRVDDIAGQTWFSFPINYEDSTINFAETLIGFDDDSDGFVNFNLVNYGFGGMAWEREVSIDDLRNQQGLPELEGYWQHRVWVRTEYGSFEASGSMNIELDAYDGEVGALAIKVYGTGTNPFGTSNCDFSSGYPTPNPTVTPYPTVTNTATATATATITNTPTITPTPTCPRVPVVTYDFSASDGGWSNVLTGYTTTSTYSGGWIHGDYSNGVHGVYLSIDDTADYDSITITVDAYFEGSSSGFRQLSSYFSDVGGNVWGNTYQLYSRYQTLTNEAVELIFSSHEAHTKIRIYFATGTNSAGFRGTGTIKSVTLNRINCSSLTPTSTPAPTSTGTITPLPSATSTPENYIPPGGGAGISQSTSTPTPESHFSETCHFLNSTFKEAGASWGGQGDFSFYNKVVLADTEAISQTISLAAGTYYLNISAGIQESGGSSSDGELYFDVVVDGLSSAPTNLSSETFDESFIMAAENNNLLNYVIPVTVSAQDDYNFFIEVNSTNITSIFIDLVCLGTENPDTDDDGNSNNNTPPNGGGGNNCGDVISTPANLIDIGGWIGYLWDNTEQTVNCTIMPPIRGLYDWVTGAFSWMFSTAMNAISWTTQSLLPYIAGHGSNLYTQVVNFGKGIGAFVTLQYQNLVYVAEIADTGSNIVTGYIDNGRLILEAGNAQANGLMTALNNVPAYPPDYPIEGLPDCVNAPLESNLCAFYYVLEYTLLYGVIGSAIVPSVAASMALWLIMYILNGIKRLLTRVEEMIE